MSRPYTIEMIYFNNQETIQFNSLETLRTTLLSVLDIPLSLQLAFENDSCLYAENHVDLFDQFECAQEFGDTVRIFFRIAFKGQNELREPMWISNFQDLVNVIKQFHEGADLPTILLCETPVVDDDSLEEVVSFDLEDGEFNARFESFHDLVEVSDSESEDYPRIRPKLFEPLVDRIDMTQDDTDEKVGGENAVSIEDVSKNPVAIAMTSVGSSFICRGLKRDFNTTVRRTLSKAIGKEIIRVSSSWPGVRVVYEILRRGRFTKVVLDAIRSHANELIQTHSGAAIVQSVFDCLSDQDKVRTLASILRRGNVPDRVNSFREMAGHRFGSLILAGAIAQVSHGRGHAMICDMLLAMGSAEMTRLCVDPFGYFVIQAVIGMYLCEEQKDCEIEHMECHRELWTRLVMTAGELSQDRCGQFVVATMFRYVPEQFRESLEDEVGDQYNKILRLLRVETPR